MKKTNRRNFLRNGATVAAAAAAGVVGTKALKGQQAQTPAPAPAKAGAPAKKGAPPVPHVAPPTTTPGFEQFTKKANKSTGLFNSRVAYGPLLFISGVGHHPNPPSSDTDIKSHTEKVLASIKASLEAAGSSMDKVVKCNVYLDDLKDYAGMNEVFRGKFGEAPPVRTTVACKGGIPGDSLVEIDVIAYI